MADNHTADCDNLMDWMDFAAGLPVCSQSHKLSFEITDIKFVIRAARHMGDNMIFMFNSNRKQSSDVKQQILLLVYDAKKLLKEEFSYMQSEVYRIEDDISKFNALVNLTVDGDIVQALRCPECSSHVPDAAMIRRWPCSLFLDKFLWDRKHNAYKLYGQYADLCNTFENTVLVFKLVNLKPMNLLIKFRLLCHLSMEHIPVITTVNLVIVHNYWGHQTLAAISLRKPYLRLMAAMSQENRKIYHIIPTLVNLLITHLIFSMNPITHWNWKLQIWINQF